MSGMEDAFSTEAMVRRDGWVRVDELERELKTARDEIELLNDALKLKTAGEEYAHRLAVMLECALLDRRRTWDDGHALLAEYRAACVMADEPPTFMGEPLLTHNAQVQRERSDPLQPLVGPKQKGINDADIPSAVWRHVRAREGAARGHAASDIFHGPAPDDGQARAEPRHDNRNHWRPIRGRRGGVWRD